MNLNYCQLEKNNIIMDATKIKVYLHEYVYSDIIWKEKISIKVKEIFNVEFDKEKLLIRIPYKPNIPIHNMMCMLFSELIEIVTNYIRMNPNNWSGDEIRYLTDPNLSCLIYDTLIFNNEFYIKL